MKTKSKVKVKSKRDETVIEGQWRATARYGGSGAIAVGVVFSDATGTSRPRPGWQDAPRW